MEINYKTGTSVVLLTGHGAWPLDPSAWPTYPASLATTSPLALHT